MVKSAFLKVFRRSFPANPAKQILEIPPPQDHKIIPPDLPGEMNAEEGYLPLPGIPASLLEPNPESGGIIGPTPMLAFNRE